MFWKGMTIGAMLAAVINISSGNDTQTIISLMGAILCVLLSKDK